mmetsp:Transcript_16070/g.36901  ORF Transcript_16070/g.36901 Transcript_16070/m.36901 type:complete len:372 (-) Transcript_16070:30-1145(-)|eukprot:CAMPEP_0116842982 /NCGR_PEP_ID=MMETSP0418-20121206/11828_1 /TAXON_ID=1158023 /ORGANISM="Astrosyne radiata, Strain 13vi08-1A" /LENGTH=371 /DNA_ID=CAMNT_0004473671 /DNA_START=242 /DNA_END=1357 /DNA_ORIENTATION=-
MSNHQRNCPSPIGIERFDRLCPRPLRFERTGRFESVRSVNSNLSKGSTSSQQSQAATTTTTKKRRRVRFAKNEKGKLLRTYDKAPSNHRLKGQSDCERRWWQDSDFDKAREGVNAVSDAIDNGGDAEWENMGKTTYHKTIQRLFRSCVKNDDKWKTPESSVFQDLQFWVRVGHSRRGLERFIVNDVGVDMEHNKGDLIEGVLKAQKKCDKEEISDDQRFDMIRKASQKHSTVSARLAAALGKADEAVLKEQENVDVATPASSIRKKIKSPKSPDSVVEVPDHSIIPEAPEESESKQEQEEAPEEESTQKEPAKTETNEAKQAKEVTARETADTEAKRPVHRRRSLCFEGEDEESDPALTLPVLPSRLPITA